jgi:hypothetical protein
VPPALFPCFICAMLPTRRPPRRVRERHPLVYFAGLSLLFSILALFARFGMFYVGAGAVGAVVMGVGAIVIVLRGRGR